VYLAKLVIIGETVRNLGHLPENFDHINTRLSWSLKVIGTDTDLSATCDFLLVFHSNYKPFL